MKACNQCGKCCIHYSDGGLSATADEIENWKAFKPEIYQYVKEGNIWMDPESGAQLKRCPFLQENSNKKYTCSIYLDRPDDCRHYPVTISEMIRDECEMIEVVDLQRPKFAQIKLDKLMADSRPSVS
jgi:Fe-S-cluster containining protein